MGVVPCYKFYCVSSRVEISSGRVLKEGNDSRLPRSHRHQVGLPVEASLNCTITGAQPCLVLALKPAEICA